MGYRRRGGRRFMIHTSGDGANECSQSQNGRSNDDSQLEHKLERFGTKERPEPVDEAVDLKQTEHAEGCHVLARLYGLETDEGNLHRKQRAERVHCAVGDVQTIRESTG